MSTIPRIVTIAAAVLSCRTAAAQGTLTSLLPSPPAERCAPAPTTIGGAAHWLDRAAARVLPPSFDGKVLRYRASHDRPLWEQSDRPYEPYVPSSAETLRWFDPAAGVEGRQAAGVPVSHARYATQIAGPSASFAARDTVLTPSPGLHTVGAVYRRLNPWAVLLEWRARAGDARVVERCMYREYARVVLARGGERLYLSESDGVPIKLDRTEPHYLFGQVKASYVWTTWWGVRGGGVYPFAAFRQFDGTTYERVGVAFGSMALVPLDSAPRLDVPAVPAMSDRIVIPSLATDTIRVDDHTFLLVTPAYTETVTLQRDTVFLLDATSGEVRGRQDSVWIAKLFPGKHPVTLVVTDLAWPHINSVRFWVARGALVVSHRASEDFIRRVVARRFTLEPDALEQVRATATLKFRAVDDSLRLAGGAVVIHAMRGNSTEGALAVWLPTARFLWAGDYVQPDASSPYFYDVVQTARVLGIRPDKVGAQHVSLSNWADLEARVPRGVQP